MIRIIEENQDFLVCIKPYGISSQNNTGVDMVKLLSEQTDNEIFCVHRLDKEVSGLMIFAKNKIFAADISSQIASGKFVKYYIAVIDGKIRTDISVLEDLLFRDSAKNKTYTVKKERKGVKKAKLSFESLGITDNYSLLKIRLFTGRTHQIRVQFSSRGFPLIGDRKYGSREKCNIALWSYKLQFQYNGADLEFTSVPDSDNHPWLKFKNILKSIE